MKGPREAINQDGLIYGGLIAIAVVMVQGILEALSRDASAKASSAALSVAIPLPAALVMGQSARDLSASPDGVRKRDLRESGRSARGVRRARRRLLAHLLDCATRVSSPLGSSAWLCIRPDGEVWSAINRVERSRPMAPASGQAVR